MSNAITITISWVNVALVLMILQIAGLIISASTTISQKNYKIAKWSIGLIICDIVVVIALIMGR